MLEAVVVERGADRGDRPSIMSDGATTSAPASACETRGVGEHLERDVVFHVAVLR